MRKTRTIQLEKEAVEYMLHKRRGVRKLTLTVRADGSVLLTVPWWVSQGAAARYLHTRRDWLMRALAQARARGVSSPKDSAAHYKKHKEAARAFVRARLEVLNEHYGYSWGRVAIRSNNTCWGSCSSKQNLNFDYRILFLPPHLQDYILAHELCHLKEMNHSPRFWALVARAIPDYKRCRTELRTIRK